MVLKRIGVLSAGKILGMLYGIIGFIVGGFFSLFSLLGVFASAFEDGLGGSLIAGLFGLGAIILLPLFYGVLGFVVGIVVSALYNGLAKLAGGIQLELE